MVREHIDGSVNDVLSGDGTELPDGRIASDSPGCSGFESFENCDRMEEFGLGTIGEDGAERHSVVFIRSRMKRLRNSGDTENLRENLRAAHGVLLSVGKEEWLEYTIFLSGKEVIV